MSDIQRTFERLSRLGLAVPEILLPADGGVERWAVIACDQFTQDRGYWERARAAAAGFPSALNLVFPEAFLADTDRAGRIEAIHKTMRAYLDGGVFAGGRRGFVYIERDTPFNTRRRGLVAAVDLEYYSWKPDARPLIRSTEGTVPERLPVRMDIRRGAPLETQHVLLLIDDDTDTLLPALGEMAKKSPPAYNGRLMLDSGNITGWFLDDAPSWDFLAGGLEKLKSRAVSRYGAAEGGSGDQPFLFAAGDGNHSLASAKEIWEEYKAAAGTGDGIPDHPCRYALVEIENIYDQAIQFEPIHRAVFGLGIEDVLNILSTLPGFSRRNISGRGELVRLCAEPVKGNRFGLVSKNCYILAETSAGGISTACLQPLLDSGAAAGNSVIIDYIHGEDELFRLAALPETVTGILLPPVQKAGFFETVARRGPLPRKSFSMGEAAEKRFYIECRKLF